MLDIKLIREQPDLVKDGMAKVGQDPAIIDRVLALDVEWRSLVGTAERVRPSRRNTQLFRRSAIKLPH